MVRAAGLVAVQCPAVAELKHGVVAVQWISENWNWCLLSWCRQMRTVFSGTCLSLTWVSIIIVVLNFCSSLGTFADFSSLCIPVSKWTCRQVGNFYNLDPPTLSSAYVFNRKQGKMASLRFLFHHSHGGCGWRGQEPCCMWQWDFGCAAEKFCALVWLLGSQSCWCSSCLRLTQSLGCSFPKQDGTRPQLNALCISLLPSSALLCWWSMAANGLLWCVSGLFRSRQEVLLLDRSHKQARLSLCFVCVEESVCCHVPSLKKFGVCFSWEVPACDPTEQFSAVRPQSTKA